MTLEKFQFRSSAHFLIEPFILIKLNVFVPLPCYFDDYALQCSLKSRSLIPPAPFFFLKIALAIQGILCLHTNVNSVSLILLLIPSSIFFISVIILFISFFVLQFFQVFLNHILHFLDCCLHSFPKTLDYLHYHNFEFFFLIGCLYPLHLVILLRLHFVPSSGTYFSAISFFLTLSLWFPFFRIEVLTSAVCSLVYEAV